MPSHSVTLFIPIDHLSTLVRDWSSTLARWCMGSARYIEADDPHFDAKVIATMLACHMLEHRFWCIEREVSPPRKIIEPEYDDARENLTGYQITYEFDTEEDAKMFGSFWQ